MRKLVYPFFFFLYFAVLIFVPLELFTRNVYVAFIPFSIFGLIFPFWSTFFCTRGSSPYTDSRYTCPWSQLLLGSLILFYKRLIFPSSPYNSEYIDLSKAFIITFFVLACGLFFAYHQSDLTNIRLCNVFLVLLVVIFFVMFPSLLTDSSIQTSPSSPSAVTSSSSSYSFSSQSSSVSKQVPSRTHASVSSSASSGSSSYVYRAPPSSPWGEDDTTEEITGPLSKTSYWTPNGKSYHFRTSCPSLSRSKTIHSGTLSDALDAGKTDPCNNCAGG